MLSSLALNQTGEMGRVQCQPDWIKGEHFQRRMIMWEFAFEKTFVLYHNHSYDAGFNHSYTVEAVLHIMAAKLH